jgi:hypothetical protein
MSRRRCAPQTSQPPVAQALTGSRWPLRARAAWHKRDLRRSVAGSLTGTRARRADAHNSMSGRALHRFPGEASTALNCLDQSQQGCRAQLLFHSVRTSQVLPSMSSRAASRCPAWTAVSVSTCRMTSRRLSSRQYRPGHFPTFRCLSPTKLIFADRSRTHGALAGTS